MINLYTWNTPNGQKISIMLEETGLDYIAHPINIGKEEQFDPEFLKISPNNKIPAITDTDTPNGPISIFESGAILIYLAEKSGKFLPSSPIERSLTLQWLMWQMGGYGPMTGQFYHFNNLAEKPEFSDYAFRRFKNEVHRLHLVLDKQLENKNYVTGEYSIADMALYPWVKAGFNLAEDDTSPFPNILRWLDIIGQRATVGRGMCVPLLDQ